MSEGDSSVGNVSLLQDSPTVKASDENIHLGYKHKLTDIFVIHCCELHQ